MSEIPPASRYTGKPATPENTPARDPLQFSNPELAMVALDESSEQADELTEMNRLAAEHLEALREEIRSLKPRTEDIRNLQDIEGDYDSFARGKVNVHMVREMRDRLAAIYQEQGKLPSETLKALGARVNETVPGAPTSVEEFDAEMRGTEDLPQPEFLRRLVRPNPALFLEPDTELPHSEPEHTGVQEEILSEGEVESVPQRTRPSSKVRTARPGQKGARTSKAGETLKSLADLGPAIEAARQGRAAQEAPGPAEVTPGQAESVSRSAESEADTVTSKNGVETEASAVPATGTAETHAEKKAELQSSVSKLQEFAEKAGFGAERTAMLEAEKAYLAKHREFYAKNDVLERLLKRSIGRTGLRGGGTDIKELKELKQKYDEARISYDNAIRGKTYDEFLPGKERMDVRLREKYERLKNENALPKNEAGQSVDLQTFMQRSLERRGERSAYHLRAKEILNRAGKQVDARAEGLNEKGLELWDRVPNLLAKGNAALEKKFGKNGARVVKALGATSFVLGGMAVGALGGAAVLSAGALLGVGSATFGRKLLASTLIGPAARAAARVVYDRTRGKQLVKEAKAELGRMDKDKGQLTAKRLAAYDTKRIKLSEKASGEYQKRERGFIEFAVTFVAGGGAATALFNEETVDRALDSMPPEVRHEVEEEARQIGTAIERAAEQAEQPAVDAIERTAGGAGAASEVSQLAERAWHAEPLTVTLDRLEGADHLFTDMRSHLLDQYPDEATRPPAVEHILSANHPNALSREFGFAEGMNSLVMHEGDAFSITAEGNLVFVREGSDPVVLLESNGHKPEGFVPVNDRPEFQEMPSPSVATGLPVLEEQAEVKVETQETQSEVPEAKPEEVAMPAPPLAEPTAEAPPASSGEYDLPPQTEEPPEFQVEEAPTTVPEGVRGPGSPLATVSVGEEAVPPETQTIHEAIRSMNEAPATIPESPAVFDGYPHESFTNSYDQVIDPSRAGVYENADGAAFVFGGDYAQMRQAAEAFAKEHPGTLVTFEDRPHLTESGQVERSAARLLSDERGRIIIATYQENRALVDQIPNPYTFVSRIN